MRQVTIGAGERRIDANAFTTIVYERSFGRAHTLDEDVNKVVKAVVAPGQLTMLPIGAMLRLEYALERSATSGAYPDYDSWLRSFPVEGLDQSALMEPGSWASGMLDEVVATFFPRYATADVVPDGAGGGEGASARA